ncbi:hypothetical protein AVEN_270228-1 [Araneus ventricosus]|uniref:Uncharacterized protein n=1 Tax=Araneus ventricosus TaxID=182803 RepID=A0A4Y2G0E9_ARAVE|nr:hypothetical protein AVEN_270228-1 [Araneus ventricosus]
MRRQAISKRLPPNAFNQRVPSSKPYYTKDPPWGIFRPHARDLLHVKSCIMAKRPPASVVPKLHVHRLTHSIQSDHTDKNCDPGNQPKCARCGEFSQ